MKKTKLKYRFHNPNPAGVAAEYILRVLIEANTPKFETAIRAAQEQAAAQRGKTDNAKSA